ncbi:hypothetical protein MIND_00375900 [Mycena indigotica]|uniref:Uncharacterized protein n=1 Tax=Mycena indigotica TaxID=2126181 RepID=A0A8H6T5Y8_9AGAR|nr:uncharacterized protein MIND_00375900 [Mycena indigotica]KAF7310030.1 hypothetical protein MIND_00375900 [Mycena indigotica]
MTDDVFLTSPRKAPAHRRSATALRAADSQSGGFSLAHELAVAMMPEPSSGSKLLAEEFGIEFDEGAEGIDGDGVPQSAATEEGGAEAIGDDSFVEEQQPEFGAAEDTQLDVSFGSPMARKQPEQDAIEILAQNLESTDKFLSHLRHLDVDASASPVSTQPALEKLASDVIRRINETARDREGQLRELLEYDREFRRIAGEVGGQDVLGRLEELPSTEDSEPEPSSAFKLGAIPEDEPTSASPTRPTHLRAMSQEWETDPDADMDPAFAQHNDEPDDDDEVNAPASPTPGHTSFAPPSRTQAPPSAAAQLSELRGLTTSLVASLTSVSEHAQVNGAATADAGRKLRALRNRLGGWRTEWEGAERSRVKIERWEMEEGGKRVDGREVVKDHLSAFERALADAAVKTQAIMAAS